MNEKEHPTLVVSVDMNEVRLHLIEITSHLEALAEIFAALRDELETLHALLEDDTA